MNNIDIVELIEKNPITKLTSTYNNKLLVKITQNFSQNEQKLFVSSFYCYLNYDETNDFIIDFDNIWAWLGFSNKANAKRVLYKNFIKDLDYKFLLIKLDEQKKDNRGGHNKETIMLNIETFKLFCLKAETKKANEIHKYFVKLEKILQQTIEEESQEFKLQIQNLNIKMIKDKATDRHTLLLNKFAYSGSLVYLIKVKTFENGSYIVKIGESRLGIANRVNEHKLKYEECCILDCFPVNQSKKLESFLHSHQDIKSALVTDLKGHEKERELFLIGNTLSYKKLIQIINDNIKHYNDNASIISEIEKLKLENENLKLLLKIDKTPNNSNLFSKEILSKLEILEKSNLLLEKSNKEILEKLNSIQVKNASTTNFGEVNKTTGSKLQKINPDTLTLVKTYECMSEVLKENPKLKRSSIGKAITDNTVYQGFRWLFVDRELDASKIHNIEPTKKTRPQNTGYIAKLDKDKTVILEVYLDRKTACKENNYKSDSSLDNPVKYCVESNNNFYMLYEDCSEEIKNNFIKKIGTKPVLYKSGIGQYDEKNKLVQEYVSKLECCQILGIGDKSLKKSLEKNIPYNKYTFRYLDAKIKL
jgi:phage anti-repressor protein